MGRWSTSTSRSNASSPADVLRRRPRARASSGRRPGARPEVAAHDLGQHLGDQRRLAGAGDPGDRGQHAQRHVDGRRRRRLWRVTPRRCSQPCGERGACSSGVGPAEEVRRWWPTPRPARARRPAREYSTRPPRSPAPGPMSTTQSARRTTSMSCSTTNSELPAAFSRSQHVEQRLGVGRVQPGGRLVEHVDDAEQPRAQLGGDPQPLRLAGRQRRRGAAQAAGSPGRGRAAPRCARPGRR